MADHPLVECSFLIPIRRDANLSDGEFHSPKVWAWLDDELYVRFHARTTAPGHYHGFYRDPDTEQPVVDESYKYFVAVSEGELESVRTLLSAACVLFKQKCIYLSIAGRVEFIEAPQT